LRIRPIVTTHKPKRKKVLKAFEEDFYKAMVEEIYTIKESSLLEK